MSQTIKMTVKYFASIREAIGISFETVVCEVDTVGALRDALVAKGTPYAEVLARGRSVRTALNQVMCEEATLLQDGCEVAFFPPVTGG
jgi:sulfur-carrier protein